MDETDSKTDPAPLRRPIFIIGTVRSGSTLLARCLSEHPEVAWPLGRVGVELSTEWCEWGDLDLAAPTVGRAHCLPNTSASPLQCERVRRGFASLLAAQGGKPRFLNKQPHLWNKLGYLRDIFPDANLVVTGRDLRSTVASIQLLWRRLAGELGLRHYLPAEPEACWSCAPPAPVSGVDPARLFPGGDIRVLAEYWLRVHEGIDRVIERCFTAPVLTRHRDLLFAPRQTLAQLFDRLGLAPAPEVPSMALDRSRNDRWRSLLTRQEQIDLDGFIDAHRERIERLRYADTTL